LAGEQFGDGDDLAAGVAGAVEQQQGAVQGLRSIAEAGLLPASAAVSAARPAEVSVSTWSEDLGEERRYLEVQKILLRASVSRARRADVSTLLAAVRDPARRIRIFAAAGLLSASVELEDVVAQSVYLSALYDPEPQVQAVAIRALAEGRMPDRRLRDLALDRVRRSWDVSPKSLRVLMAQMFVRLELKDLLAKARDDLSWEVRRAAESK
jgi:hypothetical protein